MRASINQKFDIFSAIFLSSLLIVVYTDLYFIYLQFSIVPFCLQKLILGSVHYLYRNNLCGCVLYNNFSKYKQIKYWILYFERSILYPDASTIARYQEK